MAIFFFIGILTLLVVVHELGHFSFAKLFKVKVLEFGLGYPPKLLKLTYKETAYTLNLLPLGGFVRMLEEEDSTNVNSFAQKKPWQRLAILSAGSLMNLILPFFLFWAAFAIPHSVPTANVVILEISPNSPAELAGLAPGDVIRKAKGEPILNSEDLISVIRKDSNPAPWLIERNQSLKEIYIPASRKNPPEGQGPVGIRIGNGKIYLKNIMPGTQADIEGFKNGDLLLSLNEQPILNEQQFLTNIQNSSSSLVISVLRGNQFVKIQINASADLFTEQQFFVLESSTRSNSLIDSAQMAIRQIITIFELINREIISIFEGNRGMQLAGPIGIAQITGEAAKAGFNSLLLWAGILSINLAILNLLPIPALDGGRIVFVLIELARGGKRLEPKYEKLIHAIGFLGVISLVLIVSIADIQRIIGPT